MDQDHPDPPDKSEETELGSTETVAPTQVSGRRIGPYRLLQKVGEGGMGEVYEAEQEKPVRRRVALKIIKHERSYSCGAQVPR